MPFVLLIIGAVFLDAAVRNTVSDSQSGPGLGTLLKGDFTGKDNYLYWMTAILIIGSIGYVDALKVPSRLFMVLVLLVLFLSNGGFFSKAYAELFGASIGSSPANVSSSPAPSILTNSSGASVPTSLIGN